MDVRLNVTGFGNGLPADEDIVAHRNVPQSICTRGMYIAKVKPAVY
jgi:hypothetical protein